MVAFLKDRRGAVAIQVVLLLPILIIIIIGAVEVWRVLYVRQVLNDAAYQAARLVALQPYYKADLNRDGVEESGYSDELAKKLVLRYARANYLIEDVDEDDPSGLPVSVSPFVYPVTGNKVTVDATFVWVIGGSEGVHYDWIPFLGRTQQMHVHAAGQILGGPCE